MKRLILFASCLLAWGAFLRADPDGLTVGIWNVRNYLLDNRWTGAAFRFEYPKPEAEKRRLRETLLAVRPDVLLLQEIGTDDDLRELQEDLGASGLDYPYKRLSRRDGSRTGLAILSCLPVQETIFHDPVRASDGQPLLQRGIQEILLVHKEARLRIFHLHLKSRYTTDADDPESKGFRGRELEFLARLAGRRAGIQGGRESLVLAGDFNTPFSSPQLDLLRQSWQAVPVADRAGKDWSYHHYRTGTRERIDGFWKKTDSPGSFAGAGVFPAGNPGASGSDHRLVVIRWVPDPALKGSRRALQANPSGAGTPCPRTAGKRPE